MKTWSKTPHFLDDAIYLHNYPNEVRNYPNFLSHKENNKMFKSVKGVWKIKSLKPS